MPSPPDLVGRDQSRWQRAWADTLAVTRALLGVPDYQRYLQHHASRHPECLPMTRQAFFRQREAARYARGSNRCC